MAMLTMCSESVALGFAAFRNGQIIKTLILRIPALQQANHLPP